MTAKLTEGDTAWIGSPPPDWELKRLKYVTDFVNGAAFKPAEWTDAGTPIIRIQNLNGGGDFNHYPGAMPAKYIVEEGDLLFGWSGNRGTSFGPFRWMRPGRYYLNQHIFRVHPHPGYEPAWLYWALKAVTHHVEDRAHGIIGMVHITRGELDSVVIPVPPVQLQNQIAQFIDRKTAAIDALIAKKERLIELLEEKRQALITQAVTKGLDPNVPMKDSGIEWLGEIPSHWKVKRLKHLARVHSGLAKGRSLTGPTAELPYLRVANVQDGYLNLEQVATIAVAPSEVARFALQPGDVLMNEGGDNDKLGRGAVWRGEISPCLHQNHVFAVRPMTGAHSEWLAMSTRGGFLKMFFLSRSKQSTNLASISSTNLKEAPIVVPPATEMQSTLSALVTELGKLDTLSATVARHIVYLREYRQALITAAVTGQLDVSEAS